MNDRFKFRCYNKFQEKMFNVKSMSYINGIVQRIEVQDDDRILIFDEWLNNIDNTVLMQSTGLKDKNGKLIYEGDIVKFNFDTDEIKAVVSWDNKELIGFYLNTTDYFKDKYVTDYDFYKNDYEVIGNIYENPELLEEECQK